MIIEICDTTINRGHVQLIVLIFPLKIAVWGIHHSQTQARKVKSMIVSSY